MDKNAYLDLLSTKNYQRQKFHDYTEAVLEPGTSTGTMLEQIYNSFDIDNAAGVQLDTIGELVGISRTLSKIPSSGDRNMSDEEYRVMIKLKIARNMWDGTSGSAAEIYKSVFGNNVLFKDNQDMTMETWIMNPYGIRQSDILKYSDSFLVGVGVENIVKVIGQVLEFHKNSFTAITGISIVEDVKMQSDAQELLVEDIEDMYVEELQRRTVRMLE